MQPSSRSPIFGPHGWVRPWMIAVPAGVAIVAVVGLVALERIPLPGVSPIDPASAMQISLIQPVEPEVAPGGTMEVGELVDGYTHVAAAPAPAVDAYEPEYASAWLEPAPESRDVVWRSSSEPTVSPTAPQPEAAPAGNPYGFDAPGPDYAAEREARRERLAQMQRDGWREVPRDARLSSDSTFY